MTNEIVELIIRKGCWRGVELHGNYGRLLIEHPINPERWYMVEYGIPEPENPETWTRMSTVLENWYWVFLYLIPDDWEMIEDLHIID